MLSTVRTGAVYGVDASLVDVEVHIASGGNGEFQIVGLPDTAIRESRARIQAAIRNSGFEVPFLKITVNLAPAGVRKEGSAFDLPVAVGVLNGCGELRADTRDVLIVGELSLDGRLRPVRGCLAVALLARSLGISKLIVPFENGIDAALANGVAVYPMRTLTEVIGFLNGTLEAAAHNVDASQLPDPSPGQAEDFSEVHGQPHARRAVEVAVAGGHNILMVGSPGAGKTLIARRIGSILPPMTLEESLETTRVHSAAGSLQPGAGLLVRRPFRAPHHSVSAAGLIGGGSIPRPGEVSLAHHGVLFLDELPEFRRHVLEVLRQPLEERWVTIARAQLTLSFPANFLLVGAMNPCPCGHLGDERRECRCTPGQIARYRSRISGPLLDRIDIQVQVPGIRYREMTGIEPGEDSATIRKRVMAVRALQACRFDGTGIHTNTEMATRHLHQHCTLNADGDRMMEHAVRQFHVSARGYARILKVARTVADLAGSPEIKSPHLAEAIRYRMMDMD